MSEMLPTIEHVLAQLAMIRGAAELGATEAEHLRHAAAAIILGPMDPARISPQVWDRYHLAAQVHIRYLELLLATLVPIRTAEGT